MFPADRRSLLIAAIVGTLLVGLLPAVVLAAAPVADDDHASVPRNAPATTIDVLDGDTGVTLTIVSATDPAHGTVVVALDQLSLTYAPDLDFHGTDTFDYTMTDGDTTDVGTVTVDVNSPPVAVDDPNTTCQNPVTFGGAFPYVEDYVDPAPGGFFPLGFSCALLSNDTDPDGDTLSWEIVSQPAHGEAIKIDEQFFGFKPDPDYSAADHGLPATDFDSFTYRAFDGIAYSAPATMRFWVAPINDPPTFTAGPPIVVVGENSGPYSAPWATVVSPGPSSESWQTVHFEADTPPNGVPNLFGALPALDENGILTFTPNPDEVGLVNVTVRAKDDGGLEDWQVTSHLPPPDDTSDDVTFQIVVMPVSLDAVDDEATLPEDPDPGPWLIDVLDNDTFPPEGTITEVTQGILGLVTISDDGLYVLYAPDPDAYGDDSFTYTLDDGDGTVDTATVDLTITPVNDQPVAGDDVMSVRVDGAAKAVDVLADDTDVDGDSLLITETSESLKGTVTITGGGTGLTYQPDEGEFGSDSFTYTISDGHGGTATANVAATITQNGAPTAIDDTLTVLEDDPATAVDVLDDDSDPDDDPFLITTTSIPTKGTVVITGGGTGLTYEPDPNASGADTFTYTIDDDLDGTDTATVSVTITPANDDPEATNDTLTVAEDAAATAVPVLTNDSDPDGDPRTITAKTDGAKGVVVITGGGTGLTYTPNLNANGSDSFTYTIGDGHGAFDTATVDVTINPANDAPDATTDTLTVAEDDGATAVDVLGNDSDPDHDPLLVTAKTNGAKGVVAITGGGTGLTYDPNDNANGADSFTYTVNDGHGGTDTATVNVTITPHNDAPDATNDSLTIAEDASTTAVPVLGNDQDVDGDTRTITAKTNGAKGVVAITGGGTGLTYTPNPNANGSDSFTYTIGDGHGGSDTATVTVTINPVNDKPDARNDTAFTVQQGDGARALTVLTNDTDPDTDPLHITAKTDGAHGPVAITGGGTGLTYNPAGLYFGSDVFTYTISDGHGGTDTATVLLTVVKDVQKPVATAPVQIFVNGTTGTSTMQVRLNWGGTDTGGTGIASYKLQVSRNGGAWSTVTSSTTATSSTRTVTVNATYRYRVRATDKGGNVGLYVYGPTFKVVRVQNNNAGLVYAGPWTTSSNASALGGSHRYTSVAGSSVSYTGSMRNVAWIATKTSSSGSAQIWIDGSLAATINLRSSSTGYRKLVFHRDFGTLGTHTIEIRSLGGGRVYLDALSLLR